MASKPNSKTHKITTIKLKSETKERLDHLKEFERESYDETLRKLLFILNTVRSAPESAQSILHNIDSKIKRKYQVSQGIPVKSQETTELKKENKPEQARNQKLVLKTKHGITNRRI